MEKQIPFIFTGKKNAHKSNSGVQMRFLQGIEGEL